MRKINFNTGKEIAEKENPAINQIAEKDPYVRKPKPRTH
jgi:hypothetical protein